METDMTEKGRFRGDRLKQARERRGLTQDDLNRRLNTGNTTVYRYENGKTAPSPDVIFHLSRELEVTADYLLGLVDEPDAYLQESELTPDERQLIDAYRRGDLHVAMKVFIRKSGTETP